MRKLLVEIPKQMHWNTFRFCIGPVPDKWLDIADEAGLLIQNEYFVWTGHELARHGKRRYTSTPTQMIREYREWMRDNWNHPSVAIWDANNETWDPMFGDKIIPAVRGLDLSNRPWENSYKPPGGPGRSGGRPSLRVPGHGRRRPGVQHERPSRTRPAARPRAAHRPRAHPQRVRLDCGSTATAHPPS